MKQFTPIKMLTLSLLFIVIFPAFSMNLLETGSVKKDQNENMNKKLFLIIDSFYPAYGLQTNKEKHSFVVNAMKKINCLFKKGAESTRNIEDHEGTALKGALWSCSDVPGPIRKLILKHTPFNQLNYNNVSRALLSCLCNSSNSNKYNKKIIKTYDGKGFNFKKNTTLLHRLLLYASFNPGFIENCIELVCLLVDKGVNVNGVCPDSDIRYIKAGDTPLHVLARNAPYLTFPCKDFVNALLDHGANTSKEKGKLNPVLVAKKRFKLYVDITGRAGTKEEEFIDLFRPVNDDTYLEMDKSVDYTHIQTNVFVKEHSKRTKSDSSNLDNVNFDDLEDPYSY